MYTRAIDKLKSEKDETIVSTCRLLGVSRQVYYRSLRSTARKQQKAGQVVNLVLGVRQQMPRIGTRKLYYMLGGQLSDLGVGRDKLFAIINANHLSIKPTRSYHITTNSHHRFHKHKNLITDLTPHRPEQVWVSDITYVGGRSQHTYLALVTDAYSKKVMGFDLSNSLSCEGSLRALNMAIKERLYKDEPLIHHSDRGLQYCCDEYQRVLKRHKIKCSMTESYDPYANAVAERVNGILKQEFLLEDYRVGTKDMKNVVRESIETYNTKRPHYSCRMLTPDWMHQQRSVKIRTYKKEDGPKIELGAI